MDNIKLYATNEQNVDLLIHFTGIHSDIEISFGLDEYVVAKRGKIIRTERAEFSVGKLGIQDSYKYLGILQVNGNQDKIS